MKEAAGSTAAHGVQREAIANGLGRPRRLRPAQPHLGRPQGHSSRSDALESTFGRGKSEEEDLESLRSKRAETQLRRHGPADFKPCKSTFSRAKPYRKDCCSPRITRLRRLAPSTRGVRIQLCGFTTATLWLSGPRRTHEETSCRAPERLPRKARCRWVLCRSEGVKESLQILILRPQSRAVIIKCAAEDVLYRSVLISRHLDLQAV